MTKAELITFIKLFRHDLEERIRKLEKELEKEKAKNKKTA